MPRHYTKEALAALDRVRGLLARMDEWPEPFVPNPPLTEGRVAAWEAGKGVSLPDEYRLFLAEVGDGGRIAGYSCDFEILPLVRTYHGPGLALATPFPVTQALLSERLAEGRPIFAPVFPELAPLWDTGWLPGCLHFGGYPGGDGVFLVVTGEVRGSVWCSVNSGTPESREGATLRFLDWLEIVLLDARTWG